MPSPLAGLHLIGDNGLFQTWTDGPPITRFVRVCRQCGAIFEDHLGPDNCGAKHVLRPRIMDNLRFTCVPLFIDSPPTTTPNTSFDCFRSPGISLHGEQLYDDNRGHRSIWMGSKYVNVV